MARPMAKALRTASPAPDDRYINRGQLRALIPACDMTLWRWQRNPAVAFPAPVKLGADGRDYWWLPGIGAWMRQRAERHAQRPGDSRTDQPKPPDVRALPMRGKALPKQHVTTRGPRPAPSAQ
jgi:hypothetical protein